MDRAPDFFRPHLASAMEGLPVAPRDQAATPPHGEPTLLTSGKRKEAVSPARVGRGTGGNEARDPGTAGRAGGGPLTAHSSGHQLGLPPTVPWSQPGWGPR